MDVEVPERLYPALEGMGLTPYQAGVQVALLLCGPANCVDLTRGEVGPERGQRFLLARFPGPLPEHRHTRDESVVGNVVDVVEVVVVGLHPK